MLSSVNVAGHRLFFDPDGDLYGPEMWLRAQSGDWEASTIGTFLIHANDEAIVFDIGAASGIFTILSALCGAQVVAVEPDERWLAVLRRNLDANSLGHQVTVMSGGVSNFSGTVNLNDPTSYKVLPPITRFGMTEAERVAEVRVFDLAELVTQYDKSERRLFLKMDIEGAEYAILGDVRQLEGLKKSEATVLVSFHPVEVVARSWHRIFRSLYRLVSFFAVVRMHRTVWRTLSRYCLVRDYKGDAVVSGLKFGLRIASGDKDYLLRFATD